MTRDRPTWNKQKALALSPAEPTRSAAFAGKTEMDQQFGEKLSSFLHICLFSVIFPRMKILAGPPKISGSKVSFDQRIFFELLGGAAGPPGKTGFAFVTRMKR